jgi:hypothetical protein
MKIAMLAVVAVVLVVLGFVAGHITCEEAYYSSGDFRGRIDGPGVFMTGPTDCMKLPNTFGWCVEIHKDEFMEWRTKPSRKPPTG